MYAYLTPVLIAVLAVIVAGVLLSLMLRRRLARRNESVRTLLQLADRLEDDLKTCRARLQQAHAVMSLNPDAPAASEQEARNAIDNGLRSLLQQRIWIRDQSPRANQHALDEAVAAMAANRDRLQPLLAALGQAQRDLDSAMREHIRREPDA